MTKNNRNQKASTKIYAKEVKENLDDLAWQKTQFETNRKPALDSVQEIRLKIELIKYLNAELVNCQEEANFLKQSLNENNTDTKPKTQ